MEKPTTTPPPPMVIQPGKLCSPKTSPLPSPLSQQCEEKSDNSSIVRVDSGMLNPFAGPCESQISRRELMAAMPFYTWTTERRERAEYVGSHDIGHKRMQELFGVACPEQDAIKCKSISIAEWQQKVKPSIALYGKYNKDGEDLPSHNLVFTIKVFSRSEHVKDHTYVAEVTIKRQCLAMLPQDVDKTVRIMDMCEVIWRDCSTSKVESEKRFMSFYDLVNETCASIRVTYPDYYCHYSLECFSLFVHHSDMLFLSGNISLPSFASKLDSFFNRIVCSDTQDHFVDNTNRPVFTIFVQRKSNGTVTEELELSTIFMNRFDKADQHVFARGTIINKITLLALDLTRDVLPVILDHIEHCCKLVPGVTYDITGTFSSFRAERAICFTTTESFKFSSFPVDWAQSKANEFHRAYEVASQELIVTDLPLVL